MPATPPAPTLTAITATAPSPRVDVLVTPMPVDAARVTVYRSWAGKRAIVRGAKRVAVSGDHLVTDYEAPLGVPVSYSCQTEDLSGATSQESTSSTTTVNAQDLWFQDPVDPNSALQVRTSGRAGVTVIGDSFFPMELNSDVVISSVTSSPTPVGQAGERQDPDKVPLTLQAWSASSAASLRELLSKAFPLCVRAPASLVPLYDGLLYLALPSVRLDAMPGWESFRLSTVATVIQPSSAQQISAVFTWDMLQSRATTWNEVASLWAKWTDVQRG